MTERMPWTMDAIREAMESPEIDAGALMERDRRGHTGWTLASLGTAVTVDKIVAEVANLAKPPAEGSEEATALDQVLELLKASVAQQEKQASIIAEMSTRLTKLDDALFATEKRLAAMEEKADKGFAGLLKGIKWLGGASKPGA